MTERVCTGQGAAAHQTLYARYASPVGDLIMIGAGSLLTALVFLSARTGNHPLEKKLPGGVNKAISACRSYLDQYFKHTSSRKNISLLKQTSTFDRKTRLFHITAGSISLSIDCSFFTPNECRVYAELLRIPYGSIISYGELANRSGFPGGSRFIGNTMAKNMVPIIIPCHRVIRSDGSIGNYSGGIHIKEYLLDRERRIP